MCSAAGSFVVCGRGAAGLLGCEATFDVGAWSDVGTGDVDTECGTRDVVLDRGFKVRSTEPLQAAICELRTRNGRSEVCCCADHTAADAVCEDRLTPPGISITATGRPDTCKTHV